MLLPLRDKQLAQSDKLAGKRAQQGDTGLDSVIGENAQTTHVDCSERFTAALQLFQERTLFVSKQRE